MQSNDMPLGTGTTIKPTDIRTIQRGAGSAWSGEPRLVMERLVLPMVAGLLALLLFVATFGVAVHDPQPHNVPVGIVAPAPVLAKVQAGLNARARGAFTLHTYASPLRAQAAIDRHAVDGALVITPASTHLYLASASGMASTELISSVFAGMARTSGQPPVVRDLKPLPSYDARGLTPFFLIVGLLISSVLFSVLLIVRAGKLALRARLVTALSFALLAGPLGALAVDAVTGRWIPHFWAVSVLCGALSLSVTTTTMALHRVLGPLGIALAAYTLIPLGASTAGGPINYEFLPDILRQVSQYLPPGAALSALRNTLYFGGHSLSDHIIVLALWSAAALLIVGVTAVRRPPAGARLDAATS